MDPCTDLTSKQAASKPHHDPSAYDQTQASRPVTAPIAHDRHSTDPTGVHDPAAAAPPYHRTDQAGSPAHHSTNLPEHSSALGSAPEPRHHLPSGLVSVAPERPDGTSASGWSFSPPSTSWPPDSSSPRPSGQEAHLTFVRTEARVVESLAAPTRRSASRSIDLAANPPARVLADSMDRSGAAGAPAAVPGGAGPSRDPRPPRLQPFPDAAQTQPAPPASHPTTPTGMAGRRSRTTSLYGHPSSAEQHSQQSRPQATGVVAVAERSSLPTAEEQRRIIRRDASRNSVPVTADYRSAAAAAVAAAAAAGGAGSAGRRDVPAASTTRPRTAVGAATIKAEGSRGVASPAKDTAVATRGVGEEPVRSAGATAAAQQPLPASAKPAREGPAKATAAGEGAARSRSKPRPPEEDRQRAAARQAEKENWERTRGAGSSVLQLLETPRATNDGGMHEWTAEEVLPTLAEVGQRRFEPIVVPSADQLLMRGIADYTLLPRILGRGKFSSVFMASKRGELVAVKHTALFPHHQLIATRLLREPTLLAELPPHPNLVVVKETIRTPGHFYLVEEYLGNYVTLEALVALRNREPAGSPAVLPPDVAECVLDQLLSAVRAIHHPLQICHRDIKPENILVHPETLQLKLLDFGLATHYSKSEPKLTTCCGSPAFHCPEIVRALASPPGTVSYWGPEVDAWTCGVTMLRCLTGARFPLGSSHGSLRSMAIRAQRALSLVTHQGLRDRVAALLDMDGVKRMRRFNEMVAEQERLHGEPQRGTKHFKSTTFVSSEPTHKIRLPLLVGAAAESAVATPGRVPSSRATPAGSRATSPSPALGMTATGAATHAAQTTPQQRPLVLLNPTQQPVERVVSFIKYCLRCAGILYHAWPDSSGLYPSGGAAGQASPSPVHESPGWQAGDSMPSTPLIAPAHTPPGAAPERQDGYEHVHVFQCVIELPEEEPEPPLSLVQSIMAAFGRRPAGQRSLSTPAQPRRGTATPSQGNPSGAKSGAGEAVGVRCLSFFVVARFPRASQRPAFSRRSSSTAFKDAAAALHATEAGAPGSVRQSRPRTISAGSALARDRESKAGVAGRVAAAVVTEKGVSVGTREESAQGLAGRELPERNRVVVIGIDSGPSAPPTPKARSTQLRSTPPGPSTHRADSPTRGLSIDVSTLRMREASASSTSGGRSSSVASPRASSRTSRQYRSSRSRRARVFLQVTDDRALAKVREALKVGGTAESSDAEYETDQATALPEQAEGSTPQPHAQQRRDRDQTPTRARPSPHRHRSAAASSSSSSRLAGATADSAGFPFPSRDAEADVESRGRSAKRAAAGQGIRAPSMLSREAVKEEESPGAKESELPTLTSKVVAVDVAIAKIVGSAAKPPSSTPPTPLPTVAEVDEAATRLRELSEHLVRAEEASDVLLDDQLSAVSFQLYSSVSPALGLSGSGQQEAVRRQCESIHAEAVTVLQILARHASAKELVVAVQERLGSIVMPDESSRTPSESSTGASSPRADQSPSTTMPTSIAALAGHHTVEPSLWSPAIEVSAQLDLLALVFPRIRTQKPTMFLQPFATLLPRIMRRTLVWADQAPGETKTRTQPACMLAKSLCELTQSLAEWQQRLEPEAPTSSDLLSTFFSCFSVLMSDLLRLENGDRERSLSLAETYFRRYYPRYTLPSDRVPPEGPASSHDLSPTRSTTWSALQKTVTNLDLDLLELALGGGVSKSEASLATTPSGASKVATISMGAFLLGVQLLARENEALERFYSTEVEAKLKRSLPLIVACLGAGPPPTASSSGDQTLGGTAHLSDAALTWLLWCMHALQGQGETNERRPLDEALVLSLVQAVSAHAALSARTSARYISFRLLATLLERHTDEALMLDLLHDLVCESPFPQLRVASLGLVRELVASAPPTSALLSPKLLPTLGSAVFCVPPGLPAIAESATGAAKPGPEGVKAVDEDVTPLRLYLEEHGAWISECCNLVYFLVGSDVRRSAVGLAERATLQGIQARLLAPLQRLLSALESGAGPASGERGTVKPKETSDDVKPRSGTVASSSGSSSNSSSSGSGLRSGGEVSGGSSAASAGAAAAVAAAAASAATSSSSSTQSNLAETKAQVALLAVAYERAAEAVDAAMQRLADPDLVANPVAG